MTHTSSQESRTGIPDAFYHNEMKREVRGVQSDDLDELMYELGDHIDLGQLHETLARSIDHEDPVGLLNSSGELTDGIWKFYNAKYNEICDRRGYVDGEIRGQMVAVASASAALAAAIDRAKVVRFGAGTYIPFANTLVSQNSMHAARSLIQRADTEELPEAGFAQKMADAAFIKTKQTRGRESWTWAKVFTTAESLSGAVTMREILEAVPEVSDADAEMLRRQNEELVEASISLKTYTPKPAVGELDAAGIETLFVNRDVSEHLIVTAPGVVDTHIRLFKDVGLSHSNVSLEYATPYGEGGGKVKRVAVEGTGNGAPHTDIVLYNGRDLTMLGGYVEDFAAKCGNANQAELFKSMLLMQNFDLTVPVYVVDLANEEAGTLEEDTDRHPIADKLRRLAIARTRVMNILGDEIHEEIKAEEAEDDETFKELIKHGVAGHFRRIPDGYKPSAQAHELCKEEMGVPIPPGHTYVKIHERGNVELPSRGHKLVKIPAAAAGLGRVAFK